MICLQPFSFSHIEKICPLTLGDSRSQYHRIRESLRLERSVRSSSPTISICHSVRKLVVMFWAFPIVLLACYWTSVPLSHPAWLFFFFPCISFIHDHENCQSWYKTISRRCLNLCFERDFIKNPSSSQCSKWKWQQKCWMARGQEESLKTFPPKCTTSVFRIAPGGWGMRS